MDSGLKPVQFTFTFRRVVFFVSFLLIQLFVWRNVFVLFNEDGTELENAKVSPFHDSSNRIISIANISIANIPTSTANSSIANTSITNITKVIENFVPSEMELQNASLAVRKLWELDNRIEPGIYYALNLPLVRKKPVFKYFDKERIMSERATFRYLDALLDNYIARVNITEDLTAEELIEQNQFLDSVIQTPVMHYLSHYLTFKKVLNSREELKPLLNKLWFTPYEQETKNDSSPFEHVFVGEIRNGPVDGMHSWWRYATEELLGHMIFNKLMPPITFALNNDTMIVMSYFWNGYFKSSSTLFLRTTPEFEISLYTLCAIADGFNNIDLNFPNMRVSAKLGCYLEELPQGEIRILSSFPRIQ